MAIIAMAVSFFFSRAALSMTVMLCGFLGLLGVHPRHWLKQTWWLLGVAWVLFFFISGFWSHDMDYWQTRCEVKLPILLLPLAFAFIPAFSHRRKVIFSVVVNALVLAALGYSFSFLLTNPEEFISGYDYSRVLPTLPKNDHIIFSLFVAATLVWNVYFHPYLRLRWQKVLNIIVTVIMVVSLHFLAVRTGLAAFYLFVFGWIIYLIARKKTRIIGLVVMGFFIVTGILSAIYVPTLSNRIAHTNYTLKMFREGNMSGDYSDIGRYMSYDIALKLIRQNPVKGVGAGNMLDSMKAGYDRWYPHVPEAQRLIPHNQFLTVAFGCGIPALLLFIAWVLYPLFEMKRNRAGFFFLMMWAIMLVPLMVEPVLEIQFGVFVYLFFLLWQRHEMLYPHVTEDNVKKFSL